MPDARLERCREDSKEVNCKHKTWAVLADTDIAPFHTKDGMRETIRLCYNCGKKESFIRSQDDYMKELNKQVARKLRWYEI